MGYRIDRFANYLYIGGVGSKRHNKLNNRELIEQLKTVIEEVEAQKPDEQVDYYTRDSLLKLSGKEEVY